MNKALLLLILSLSISCPAQNFAEDFSIPFQVSVDNPPDDLVVETYVVYGNGIDAFERAMIDSFTANPPSIRSVSTTSDGGNITSAVVVKLRPLSENDTSLADLKNNALIVVLVGGETHNNITNEIYSGGYVTNESTRFAGRLTVASGKLDADTSFMILKHNVPPGGERLDREAVNYSPLRGLIADEYIPVVATGIGMFLMSITNILKAMLESLSGELGKKRKVFGHTGKKIFGIYVNEALALIGAALVLGFAVTWTFAGPTPKFYDYILMNSGICLIAGLSHDLTHRILGRLFHIRVEYRFWKTGSFITVLTAFLGNSFGMQGFLMERSDESISKWKYGIMKLAGPILSIGIAAAFAGLYLGKPNVTYQMIYTSASILAMAEIMPAKGLDGYDIREWSRWVYFAAFSVISIIFFGMNFVQ